MILANATACKDFLLTTNVIPWFMGKTELKQFRQSRLQAFLDEKYEGNKAKLGRALGYKDGAMLGQMLCEPQIRPISEKTIDKIHNLPGGHGWFSGSEPDPELPSTSTILLSLSDDAVMLGAAFDKTPKEIRDRLYMVLSDYAHQAKRDFLQHGMLPEFHQPGTPLVVRQAPTTSSNAPSPRAGARAARSKSRTR